MKVLNNKTKLFESDGNKDSRYYINRIIDLLEFNRMFGKTNQEILNKIVEYSREGSPTVLYFVIYPNK